MTHHGFGSVGISVGPDTGWLPYGNPQGLKPPFFPMVFPWVFFGAQNNTLIGNTVSNHQFAEM